MERRLRSEQVLEVLAELYVYRGMPKHSGEILYTLKDAQVLLERWRWHDNHIRQYSALGYRPPAPEASLAGGHGSASLRRALQGPVEHPPPGLLGLT